MDPILISIGPLELRWYGVLIALGVVVGTAWSLRAAKTRGLDGEWLLDAAPWLVVAGIIGARLLYVVTSPSAYFGAGGQPLRALYLWEGGLSFHGAVIGVLLALWWRARIKRYDPWAYLDLLSPIAAFGIIGGRIGNFMNGSDTGGRLTDWAIGFRWPDPGTPTLGAFGRFVFGEPLWQYAPPACAQVPFGQDCLVHLAPLYGGLVGVLLIFVIAWAFRATTVPGAVFLHMVLWYSVLRGVLEEPFRDNPLSWQLYLNDAAGIGIFTLTQLVSIPIVLVCAYLLWTRGAKQR